MTTLTLTDEQRIEIERTDGPIRLIDPKSNTSYVLVRADLFDRNRDLLEGSSPRDAYPAVDRAFAEGWNDPAMDAYDRYEELKR